MRFFNASGALQKARRFQSAASSVNDDDVQDPAKLGKILRSGLLRIAELEARVPPEALEFEVNVGTSGALTNIFHNINGPIRWWVTQWTQQSGVAYPVAPPKLVQDASSSKTNLVLRSYSSGKAVVRVEPAFGDVDTGTTVSLGAADEYDIALAADFTSTNTTATDTALTFYVKAGETWWFHFDGSAGDSAVGGMKWAIGANAGYSVSAYLHSSTVNIATRVVIPIAAVNTLTTAVHTIAGGARDDQIIGVVKADNTDGYVTIQAATVTAATTVTVYAMAHLHAKKVTEV